MKNSKCVQHIKLFLKINYQLDFSQNNKNIKNLLFIFFRPVKKMPHPSKKEEQIEHIQLYDFELELDILLGLVDGDTITEYMGINMDSDSENE